MSIGAPSSGGTKASGQATLAAGTVTVTNSKTPATAAGIFLTRAAAGGTTGDLRIGTVTPGVSFVINSASALDTSTVNWMVI